MGYSLPALVTTAIVLGTNVLLRPAAMLVNRAPVEQATEVDITYRLEITCREEVEQHIRALLLQETATDALLLKSRCKVRTWREPGKRGFRLMWLRQGATTA